MKGMKGWASRRILSYTYTSTCRVCAAAASSPPYSRALADSMYLQEEWVGLHGCIHECWGCLQAALAAFNAPSIGGISALVMLVC